MNGVIETSCEGFLADEGARVQQIDSSCVAINTSSSIILQDLATHKLGVSPLCNGRPSE